MLILAAAAALLATAPERIHATAATVQATATIRVLTAVRLKLDAETNPGAPPAHNAVLRSGDGTRQPARLIEFQ